MESLIFAVIGVVVLAIIFTIMGALARKRKQGVSTVAPQIGFAFVGDKWSDSEQARDLVTPVFRRGNSREFRNIMTGASGDLHACLFDYSFVEGGGENYVSYQQTIATFAKDGVALPEFSLITAGLMEKVGSALSASIAIDAHPEFSKRYLLYGADESATRSLFTPALLTYLEGLGPQGKWRFEGTGQTLVLYRMRKRVAPAQLKAFLDETGAIAQSFFSLAGA